MRRICVVHGTLHLLGYDHQADDDAADMEAREVRALARLGIANPYEVTSLMATRQDDEGGSRLWRGMQHLIFGDDAEPTLRDAIEEAIEEAEERGPSPATSARPSGRCCATCSHFGDQTAGDICVTRGDIIAVPSTSASRSWSRRSPTPGHSRLPVFGESLDEVVGMIHIKDVFVANVEPSRDRSVGALMREPLFVPELMGVIELLARMRARAHPPRDRRRRVRRDRGPGHHRGRGRGDRRRDRGRA